MFAVMIKGFPTKKEAEEFVNWYDGQGEQNAAIWFEINNEENGGKTPTACHGKKAQKVLDQTPEEVIETAIEMV
jgi:hypothetical protein